MGRFIRVRLPVSFFRENGTYIAWCPLLDISTCAPTVKEAQENFSEMVQVFIEETDKRGTLDDILKEAGFTKVTRNHTPYWKPPRIIKEEKVQLKVPVAA